MAGLVLKDTDYDKIGLCAKYIYIYNILGSIFNIMREGLRLEGVKTNTLSKTIIF